MVIHYPRCAWKNSYAEHEVTVKTSKHTINLTRFQMCTPYPLTIHSTYSSTHSIPSARYPCPTLQLYSCRYTPHPHNISPHHITKSYYHTSTSLTTRPRVLYYLPKYYQPLYRSSSSGSYTTSACLSGGGGAFCLGGGDFCSWGFCPEGF